MKIMPVGVREFTDRMLDNPRTQNALFTAMEEVPRALFVGALMGGVYSFREGLLVGGEMAMLSTAAVLTCYAIKGATKKMKV